MPWLTSHHAWLTTLSQLRNDALVNDSVSTKNTHIHPLKTPQTIQPESPRRSGATPAGALMRTHRQNRKTSPVDKLRSTPQSVWHKSLEGSGATPVGALARTHRQDKNPPVDSAQIARGLGGSCRVHKPRVPRGPASTPRLAPSRQHVTHGPAQESKNNRPEGRSSNRPEG